MRGLLILGLLVALSASADVYVGELVSGKCKRLKDKEFMKYVKDALGDIKLDVTYDKEGACGEACYVMKKANRRRWAVFPTETGCQCYISSAKALAPGK